MGEACLKLFVVPCVHDSAKTLQKQSFDSLVFYDSFHNVCSCKCATTGYVFEDTQILWDFVWVWAIYVSHDFCLPVTNHINLQTQFVTQITMWLGQKCNKTGYKYLNYIDYSPWKIYILTYTTDLETGKNTKFSQNCKKEWLMDWNHFRRMTMLILNNQGFRQVQKATNNLMLTIILQT